MSNGIVAGLSFPTSKCFAAGRTRPSAPRGGAFGSLKDVSSDPSCHLVYPLLLTGEDGRRPTDPDSRRISQ